MKKTYWIFYPRNFANEYEVGIATNRDSAADYKERGFERIPYREACQQMNRKNHTNGWGETYYVTITCDGRDYYDFFAGARALINSI